MRLRPTDAALILEEHALLEKPEPAISVCDGSKGHRGRASGFREVEELEGAECVHDHQDLVLHLELEEETQVVEPVHVEPHDVPKRVDENCIN